MHSARHDRNQAISQTNECGNGDSSEGVLCQSLGSQIQGRHNSPSLAASQALQSETIPPPTGFTIKGTGTGSSETFVCDTEVPPGPISMDLL
jgi:hypothetical protein